MIEKVKIEELEFLPFKIKSGLKDGSLKSFYNEIFPAFSKAYEVSKKHKSRSSLSEDKEFVEKRVFILKKVYDLRIWLKERRLSGEDEEFIDKLRVMWERFSKEFPVFDGKSERLFVFWFLSFLDLEEIPFSSNYKTTSFPDLFFYERIIDYVISEKGEEEANKDDIFKVFERFTSSIDHYWGLNLLLSWIYIDNKNIREKLFEFYDSLYPEIKGKIKDDLYFLNKARIYIKQKEYEKAFKILEDKRGLFLKEKALEWFHLLLEMTRQSFEIAEKTKNLLNDINYIKNILKSAPKENLYEVSLILLYDFEVEKKEIEELLANILDKKEKEILSLRKYNLLLKRAWGYLKKGELKKAEEFVRSNEDILEKSLPFEYTKFKISYFKISGRLEEAKKIYNNYEYVEKLFKKAENTYVKAKLSLLILTEIKIFDKELETFFLKHISSIKIAEIHDKELMSLYLKFKLKKHSGGKTFHSIFRFLMTNFKFIPAVQIMEVLFFLYWNFNIVKFVRENKALFHYLVKHIRSFADNKKFVLLLRELIFNILDEENLKNEFLKSQTKIKLEPKETLQRNKKFRLNELKNIKTIFQLKEGMIKVVKIDKSDLRIWASVILNNQNFLINTNEIKFIKNNIVDDAGFFDIYSSNLIVTKRLNELLIIRKENQKIENKFKIDTDFREIVVNRGIYIADRFKNIIYNLHYYENTKKFEINNFYYDYPSNEIKRISIFGNKIYVIGSNSSTVLAIDLETNISEYINIEVEPVFIWTSFHVDKTAFYLVDFFGNLYKIDKKGKIVYKLIIDDRITSMDKYNNKIIISLKNSKKIIEIEESNLELNHE